MIELRELGSTGLAVSRIGLGLAALGRPGYINLGHGDDLAGDYDPAAMEAAAQRVLDFAWTAGVRYFDTARSYGRGEEFLARWLLARGIEPGETTVGSKWGYTYTAGWKASAEKHEVKDHTLPTLQRQYRESRDLFGPQLDLYQIHSATLESGVLDRSDVLAELARLKSAGLAIGLSVSGPRQAQTIRKAVALRIDGRALFDAVQATWNLLETSAGDALAEAHSAGLGVIVKEGLANGRLTARNSELAILPDIAEEAGTSIDGLALAAVLARPWSDVVLSGAATEAQLRSNLRAVDVEAPAVNVAEPVDQYWAKRGRLEWN